MCPHTICSIMGSMSQVELCLQVISPWHNLISQTSRTIRITKPLSNCSHLFQQVTENFECNLVFNYTAENVDLICPAAHRMQTLLAKQCNDSSIHKICRVFKSCGQYKERLYKWGWRITRLNKKGGTWSWDLGTDKSDDVRLGVSAGSRLHWFSGDWVSSNSDLGPACWWAQANGTIPRLWP